MSQRRRRSLSARLAGWDETWALALVFGLASIPWTYAFVAGLSLPLWPSFIASATFYAAGGSIEGLKRGYASNAAGIAYAAATLLIVDTFLGGSVLALSVVVGAFMSLASLHEYVPLLSFTPGGFFGYATMFSVHAAEVSAFGFPGLAGETLAALTAMFVGAGIGLATDVLSGELA
jgi:hypothetical protein